MTGSEILAAVSGPAGAIAVLLIVWWNYLTGRTVPGKLHREITADKDRQIADWKAAHAAEAARADTERARGDAALAAAQTTNAVLQALHQEVRR